VDWAQRHGHDITELRNVEEKSKIGESLRGLTCLELARQEGNWACFNILASVFGVSQSELGIDANPRAARLEARGIPHADLLADIDTEPIRTINMQQDMNWEDLLEVVRLFTITTEFQPPALCKLSLQVFNLTFLDDPSDEQIDELFTLTAGIYSLELRSCVMKTDRTCLAALRALMSRLSLHSCDRLPPGIPQKVLLSMAVIEDLEPDEEAVVDEEVETLICQYAEVCGRWPGFLGAKSGFVSSKQRARIGDRRNGEGFAASWAAIYATRLNSFLFHHRDGDDDNLGLESWHQNRELMPLARSVANFFHSQRLLNSTLDDPLVAVDPSLVPFLQMVLRGWFATAPRAPSVDPWGSWAQHCGVDETVMKQHLAPALDLVLESLVRMWKVLDAVCKSPRARQANVSSVGELIRNCVPEPLIDRLPNTRDRLRKYYGTSAARQPKKASDRVSLLSSGQSLRPAWSLRGQ
jgi:hypothetical protein